MLTANAIAYLGKSIGGNDAHFSLLILASVVIYGILAFIFKSRLIWAFVLLSFGVWFGTETGYLSRWNWYFVGLNYPLRFVFFGLAVTALCPAFKKQQEVQPLLWHHLYRRYGISLCFLMATFCIRQLWLPSKNGMRKTNPSVLLGLTFSRSLPGQHFCRPEIP